MKERQILFNGPMVLALLNGQKTQTRRLVKGHSLAFLAVEHKPILMCPYGQTGDRLWVRETWAQPTTLDPGPTIYRADYPACVPPEYTNIPSVNDVVWRPSIHMPKALSRITLEITNVRVERLQEISEVDALSEGATGGHDSIPGYAYNATPLEHYKHIWESTGGDWKANPWVWVIEFKRVKP